MGKRETPLKITSAGLLKGEPMNWAGADPDGMVRNRDLPASGPSRPGSPCQHCGTLTTDPAGYCEEARADMIAWNREARALDY